MSDTRKISLYFTEGSSDKEYHAQLEPQGNGWVVRFQYGRRGSALKAGTKTASPVALATAAKIYDRLVNEKTRKGYTPDVGGEVFQDTVAGEAFSGFLPQLPQTIRAPRDIEAMIQDPAFWLQEKYDGENRQMHIHQKQVCGINKRGLVVALPMNLVMQAKTLPDLLTSGEIIGDRLYLFDLQELNGRDLRDKPYAERMSLLARVVNGQDDIQVVASARTTEQKRALIEQVGDRRGEGVVFKRADAAFRPGKQAARDADQFKWKFTEDCTVRVAQVNSGRRSIGVAIDGPDGQMPMGNVTIPVNHDLPVVGDLVSVTYLYLFEDGRLYQPQYKGVRTDCDGPDSLDMFKIKPKQPRLRGRAT